MINYNRTHSSEMIAQYFLEPRLKFKVVTEYQLDGKVVIDAIGHEDDDSYELSHIRFHIGTTLHSYGYKFEEHHIYHMIIMISFWNEKYRNIFS